MDLDDMTKPIGDIRVILDNSRHLIHVIVRQSVEARKVVVTIARV